MILREFAFDVWEPILGVSHNPRLLLDGQQRARVDALSRLAGDIYADRLGRYETPATWKVIYYAFPNHFDEFSMNAVQATNQPGGHGVHSLHERVDIAELDVLWGADDEAAIREVIRRIHRASIAVAKFLEWETGPFVRASEEALADPRFIRARAWKARRSGEALARVTFEETLGPVRATVEVAVDGEVVAAAGVDLRFVYLEGAWTETRDIVWQRNDAVLRTRTGRELVRVTAP